MEHTPHAPSAKKKAMQLILLFGFVSLFGDIIYEGARSVNGPYLQTLGANAALVGIIAGVGEFLGYAIRLISGYFSDKTKAYWAFVWIGYGLLVSVPLLALTGVWQFAALFILMERLGKALRSPARDTIVSQAAKQIGTGWGFAIAEAMDQLGALTGPLIFTSIFFFTGTAVKTIADYQLGYALFWVPLLFLLACVGIAYIKIPHPEELEDATPSTQKQPDTLSRLFWLYTAFTFITTTGFANFLLIGYHFKAQQLFADAFIPLLYAAAMAVDGIAALIIGKTYDILNQRHKTPTAGLMTLIIIPILSVITALCAFSMNTTLAIVSMLLWGVVMGAHETIMRSAIADLTPLKKRGTGYGIFNTSYGLAMLVGSTLMGLCYEYSVPLLMVSVILIEIAALVVFFAMRREAVRVIP